MLDLSIISVISRKPHFSGCGITVDTNRWKSKRFSWPQNSLGILMETRHVTNHTFCPRVHFMCKVWWPLFFWCSKNWVIKNKKFLLFELEDCFFWCFCFFFWSSFWIFCRFFGWSFFICWCRFCRFTWFCRCRSIYFL